MPKPCFALELDLADPTCQQCPHQKACVKATGPRAEQVRLDRAVFTLEASPGVSEPRRLDTTALNGIYQIAHEQIFRRPPEESLNHAEASELLTCAVNTRLSPETYIYSCLAGHQVSCPERQFRKKYLTGETAEKRAKFYRNHAVQRFGVADPTALLTLTGNAPPEVPESFLHAEQLFGSWIVSERCRRGGNGLINLYQQRLTDLPAYWLAIEPTYARWSSEHASPPLLQSSENFSVAFNQVARLRQAVSHVPSELKPYLQRVRQGVIPAAIDHVLRLHQCSADKLLIRSPVTSAFRLWLAIGDAMLQRRLLAQVRGEARPHPKTMNMFSLER